MGEPKCRPIAFYPWEVKATLEGRKTRFSRVMSFQPDSEACVRVEHFHQTVVNKKTGEAEPGPEIFGAWWDDGECGLKCPFGAPGDWMWAKETWQYDVVNHCHCPQGSEPQPCDAFLEGEGCASMHHAGARILYRADGAATPLRWRPSIHMPRWASRITLEVTGVRVERLQDIGSADAMREGVELTQFWRPKDVDENPKAAHEWSEPWWDDHYFWSNYPQRAYSALWESINGPGSWALNPWVWVVEFRRVEDR